MRGNGLCGQPSFAMLRCVPAKAQWPSASASLQGCNLQEDTSKIVGRRPSMWNGENSNPAPVERAERSLRKSINIEAGGRLVAWHGDVHEG
jgi:hypothetical protein